MSSQNKGYSRGMFRAAPEDGAQLADFAEVVVPGGRGFVQHLFRAKKDFLKGVSHLLDAQINELEHIDAAIQDESRRSPPASASGPAPAARMGAHMGAHKPRSYMRVMSFGEIMDKAKEVLYAKSTGATPPAVVPEPPKPSTAAAPPAPPASEGTPGEAAKPPEKIIITSTT
ncbi:hypothetical protein CYFUS_005945 [Cystobacter fuscus]|uniref:Uncharacterized protein n=1 Tax=Cystobacter fuscus TaxID=43 RepID=A0A250JBE3_9BACT|nr:hypothetical protein [Cystobacter fuscus]ATB40496.1 hypothetical protein CYFUS_005945 [Cystobacter fuscus]